MNRNLKLKKKHGQAFWTENWLINLIKNMNDQFEQIMHNQFEQKYHFEEKCQQSIWTKVSTINFNG